MRVMKYLRGHIPSVVVIVLLLVVQSFCELSLPAYTSRIVDTGHSGRRHRIGHAARAYR